MKTTVLKSSPTKVKLTVLASSVDLEPIRQHVLKHFKAATKVPGFRQGMAPLSLVEKNIDQKQFLDEFMEHALNDLYRGALAEANIRPISRPSVELKKFVPFSDLTFEAEIEVLGEISLPDYKNIKLAKKTVSVVDNDVEEVIKSLQKRLADRQPVERGAKDGDELIIDFSGQDAKGQPVAGATGQDYPLILGSQTFIPGFEEHLSGLKAGQVKDFSINFPKDYALKALRSQKVNFHVEVKKVHELQEPKVDETFASKVGPFKNLKELKEDIKRQLTVERQWQADRDLENELVKLVTAKAQVDLPQILVEEEMARIEEEEKRNLAYRGQTWQEHLEIEGVSEAQHRQRQRPEAEQRVKAGLILSEIAQKEAIQVTSDELTARVQSLKTQHKDSLTQAELDKPEVRRDIEARLLTEKTLAKLLDYSSRK